MDNGEYILGILVIIAIYIYYIGDVVYITLVMWYGDSIFLIDSVKRKKRLSIKLMHGVNLTWSCYKVLNLLIISMWQSYMIIYAKGEYRG